MAVTMCNRQNLNHFEMKSRKPGQNGQTDRMGGTNQTGVQPSNFGGMQTNRNFGQNQGGGNMGPGSGGSGRPPLLPRGPIGRPNGPLLNSQPRLPQMPHQTLTPFGANPQQWSQLMQNGPRNPMHNAGPQLNPMMRMPQGNRSLSAQPLLNAPNQGDLRTQLSTGSIFRLIASVKLVLISIINVGLSFQLVYLLSVNILWEAPMSTLSSVLSKV